MKNLRIGQSKDIHKLIPGKSLKIGGIEFFNNYAVDSHSDGDVLLHAISEAIIGALGKGDLGMHFPMNAVNKNRNSEEILTTVLEMMNKENYEIINLDTLIVVDNIKIAPFSNKIKINLENILKNKNINIKATVSEGKHKDFIEAIATILLVKK